MWVYIGTKGCTTAYAAGWYGVEGGGEGEWGRWRRDESARRLRVEVKKVG